MRSGVVTPEQERMMVAKYSNSPFISKMSDSELMAFTASLIMKIHVITGWPIHDDKDYNRELLIETKELLVLHFSEMKTDEILLAFRLKAAGVKEWGKMMNDELITSILNGYLNERLALSAIEEKEKNEPPQQKIYTPEELLNIQRGDIEAFYQRCLKGIVPECIPGYFKEVLVVDGIIDKEQSVAEFLTNRLGSGIKNIYKK